MFYLLIIKDGVIGFGQGAVLASILVSKHPSLFSYLIAISGFQPRSHEHQPLISESTPLEMPSLHVYGKQDILIVPSRSELLSKCFLNSQIAEHTGGHFAPNSWPVELILEFVTKQAENLKTPKCFFPNQPLEISVVKLNEALARYELSKLDLEPLMHSQAGKNLLQSTAYIDFFNNSAENSVLAISEEIKKSLDDNVNDRIILFYLLLVQARAKEASVDSSKEYTYSVLRLFVEFYLNDESKRAFFYNKIIPRVFVDADFWRELVLMCDLCFTMAGKEEAEMSDDKERVENLKELYKKLIRLFVEQLLVDLAKVDRKNRTCLVQMLTTLKIKGKSYIDKYFGIFKVSLKLPKFI